MLKFLIEQIFMIHVVVAVVFIFVLGAVLLVGFALR